MGEKKYFRVRNFKKFQHYKDRRPSWIKLYNDLLNKMKFTSMTDSQQINLIKIWMLASQNQNRLVYDSQAIRRQLGSNSRISLDFFVKKKFIEIIADTPKNDSEMLAPNIYKEYTKDKNINNKRENIIKPSLALDKLQVDEFNELKEVWYQHRVTKLSLCKKYFGQQFKTREDFEKLTIAANNYFHWYQKNNTNGIKSPPAYLVDFLDGEWKDYLDRGPNRYYTPKERAKLREKAKADKIVDEKKIEDFRAILGTIKDMAYPEDYSEEELEVIKECYALALDIENVRDRVELYDDWRRITNIHSECLKRELLVY